MSTDALDLYDLFHSNPAAEEQGRWLDLNDTTGFKIRAFGCKAASDLRDELTKPYTALLKAGAPIPEDKNEEIGRKVLAGGIIADWKGVRAKGADGKPGDIIPYSAEAAYKLLKDLPKLAGAIISYSMEGQNFKDEVREEASGN